MTISWFARRFGIKEDSANGTKAYQRVDNQARKQALPPVFGTQKYFNKSKGVPARV
jgi:hypothetical protein